jgi:hypothetical protein
MNPRTNYPIALARSLPAARQGLAESRANEFLDLYSHSMDQAMQLTSRAFETSLVINSCLMDMYRHFFWYPFGMKYWFQAENKAFAEWMDSAAGQWMKLFVPELSCGRAEPPCERAFGRRVEDGVEVVLGERTSPPSTPEQRDTRNVGRRVADGIDSVVDAFDEEILA